MKVVGVIGSPRKHGNTHILVSRVLAGAQEAGAETIELFLADSTIQECDGCHACWKGCECAKHDDMNSLYRILSESDAYVFGTPVYWYGPTALIKAFLDRFVYFNCPENRAKIAGKSAVIVVPFEESKKDTARPLVELFKRSFTYLQLDFIGQIIVPGVSEKGDVLKKLTILQKAFELGKDLGKASYYENKD